MAAGCGINQRIPARMVDFGPLEIKFLDDVSKAPVAGKHDSGLPPFVAQVELGARIHQKINKIGIFMANSHHQKVFPCSSGVLGIGAPG